MAHAAIAIASTVTAERFLRKPQVLTRVPWSDTTLWRRVRAGDFPAPIRISPGCVAWRERDIDAWFASLDKR